jgi:outer membrane lipoprotein-sorting protein
MSGIRIAVRRRREYVTISRVIAILSLCMPLAAQSLDEVMSRIDKNAPQFKSMTAEMKSDMHTAIVNDDTIDNGAMRVKREKSETLGRIDFTGTDAKQVSFDGKTVSILYPKIKTVQVYKLGNNKALLDQLLLLGFGSTSAELKSAYDISWKSVENVDGKPADRIELIPKSKDLQSHLKKIDLWIPTGSGVPVQQQFFTSANGDYRLATYTDIKMNPNIPEGSLKLNIPKGFKIEYPTF